MAGRFFSGKLQEIKNSYREYVVGVAPQSARGGRFLEIDPGLRILREQPGLALMRYSGAGNNSLLQELRINWRSMQSPLKNLHCTKFSLKPSAKGVRAVKWPDVSAVFRWEFLKNLEKSCFHCHNLLIP